MKNLKISVILVLLLPLIQTAFAQNAPVNSSPNLEQEKAEGEYFIKVDESPQFPHNECKNLTDRVKREDCAQRKMLEHIYKNLKYPAEARENGIEGQVVIQFVVEKTGELTSFNLVREVGGGCDEAAMEVVKSMNALDDYWIPGKKDGEVVRVKYTLPIKFKLEAKKKKRRRKKSN